MKSIELKKFLKFCVGFVIPIIILGAIELILPLGYFSPEAWGSLNAYTRTGRILLPGPFYPNMSITKNEPGDLGMHSAYSNFKEVNWVTNNEGYRTSLSSDRKYDVIIIGDSMAVGSGMKQEDTPAEVLSRLIHKDVYGMGAILMSDFIHEGYIEKYKPKFVVLIQTERTLNITDTYSVVYHQTILSKSRDFVQKIIHKFGFENFDPIFVLADRFLKQNMLHYLKSKILYSIEDKSVIKSDNSPMLFLQGDVALKEIPKSEVVTVAGKIKDLDIFLKERGVTLIIVPVPNKESIYWELFNNNKQSHFVTDLVTALRERSVTSVDTYSAFRNATYKENKILYPTDNVHWNEEGVIETMNLLVPLINKNIK